MIFDGKPTSEIRPEEIKALISDHIEEDAFLDYKACPYPGNDHGKQEMIKDVSAFANGEGGYIIVGIREDEEQPRCAGQIVDVQNPDKERRRMIDLCFEKIEPRLPELDIRAIPVDDKTVLVCRVPDGPQKPYCARPDREHHYFWRRYEDGNRLMTVPEIRACLEGDRVLRELSELRGELVRFREQQTVAREMEQGVDDSNAFEVQSLQRFRQFVDSTFNAATDGKPYYRLTATPLPVNHSIDQHILREKTREIYALLERPPELRPGGWDMASDFNRGANITSLGVLRNDIGYKHLRVLWNGHVEFWTEVDDWFFRFSAVPGSTDVERKFLYPLAISEPIENFILFVKEICRLASFDGELEFTLGFHRFRGFYLAPGFPETIGYYRARSDAGFDHGPKPFPEDSLIPPPIRKSVSDLPNQISWRFVSEIYRRFDYPQQEAVPFFDADHKFTVGN